MDKGLISIIVPVYNCQNYISCCISSILNQTYKDIELIIIDDGSNDSSLSIIDCYKDCRLLVIKSEHRGVSAARNIGINASKGKFIFFMDADDYFLNDSSLELLVDNKNGIDLIIGDFISLKGREMKSGNERFFNDSKLLTKNDLIDHVKRFLNNPKENPLFDYCWGKLFKSSVIKDNKIFFDEELYTSEDLAFNFKYLRHTNTAFYLNEVICCHRNWDNAPFIHTEFLPASLFFNKKPEEMFGYKRSFNEIMEFLVGNGYLKDEYINGYMHYTIVQLIRCCGQMDDSNKKEIYGFVKDFLNDKKTQELLAGYKPSKNNSKIIPILMKLKLVKLLIWACRKRAYKRYKIYVNRYN